MKEKHEYGCSDARKHRLLMQEHACHANMPWCDEHAFVTCQSQDASHVRGTMPVMVAAASWLTWAHASHGLCRSCTRGMPVMAHARGVMPVTRLSHARRGMPVTEMHALHTVGMLIKHDHAHESRA
jgi:hypothetical protein